MSQYYNPNRIKDQQNPNVNKHWTLVLILIICFLVLYIAGIPQKLFEIMFVVPRSPKLTNTIKKEGSLPCSRTQPYTNPVEFDRAFSLIIQRQGKSNNSTARSQVSQYLKIKNCLKIEYAHNDSDINNAEGVFSFSSNSTKEQLQILVSPRYQYKDDLLTAALLSHELYHALNFVFEIPTSCYENEVNAYITQMNFLSSLNNDEVASITYRYNNNTSPEAVGVINLIVGLHNSPGANSYEKTMNYVKSIPFYQKQCGK